MAGHLAVRILQVDGRQEIALSDGIPRGEWGFQLEPEGSGERGRRLVP